ncbi:MAG: selenide, water dikinase SelD [Phycisphaerae bacterium]
MGSTAQVLRQADLPTHPDLLVGTDLFDDAGVFRISADTALVTTLDFFPPLVDDPRDFGRVAAANSLSDVYAMGGTALTALNIVGFPDKDLPLEILGEILKGGAEKVAEAGAVVAGGHSVRDAEVKYGLSVTGVVHPDRIMRNAGAKVGDALVLTKPIGTGQLTTAAKQDKIGQDALGEVITVMAHLNRVASEAMQAMGANAATDITGFGLLGHAAEMAVGSEVTLVIDSSTVPLIGGALEFARDGVLTRAHQSNLEHLADSLLVEGADDVLVKLLADAQTSGGLLISIPDAQAAALVDAVNESSPCKAAVIGRVEDRGDRAIKLLSL